MGLNNTISKMYNKNIEFNFVNLKYMYLNSDILNYAVAVKLRNRRNRLLFVLKRVLNMVQIPKMYIYDLLVNDKELQSINETSNNIEKPNNLQVERPTVQKFGLVRTVNEKQLVDTRLTFDARYTSVLVLLGVYSPAGVGV